LQNCKAASELMTEKEKKRGKKKQKKAQARASGPP
jgi:hypothetical protein